MMKMKMMKKMIMKISTAKNFKIQKIETKLKKYRIKKLKKEIKKIKIIKGVLIQKKCKEKSNSKKISILNLGKKQVKLFKEIITTTKNLVVNLNQELQDSMVKEKINLNIINEILNYLIFISILLDLCIIIKY